MSYCCKEHENSQKLAIEARNLSVRLGERLVLYDVNLDVRKGDTVALIGPNGAGKTTLLKALLGILPLESGSVKILGEEKFSAVCQKIGYVPQKLFADPSFALSVREFLSLNLKQIFWPWFSSRMADGMLANVIEKVGLNGILSRSVAELSGGQFQRVMIAFALLRKPEILFMDEPTAGIDAPGEEDFYQMIENVHKERHLAVVIVSHDLSIVYKRASHVYALNKTVCCHGAPEEIIQSDSLMKVFGREFTHYHHHHS